MKNNGRYMKNYAEFLTHNLPIGSGEAESGIRHIIKRRMAVAGAWTEEHASLMLAILTIRASGWWSDFWNWRNALDKKAWHHRQSSNYRPSFRGNSKRKQNKAA